MTVKQTFGTALPSSAAALLALAIVVGLPACETGTGLPTITGATNAQIAVSVDPSPIPGEQNSTTNAVTAKFDVRIQELNGLGAEVNFVTAMAFDPESGAQLKLVYFDGPDLIVYIGTRRLEPRGTLVVPETLSYLLSDGRKEATVAVTVQVKDDRGNLLNRSVLAQIQ